MNKKTLVIVILSAFMLTVSVGFVEAQNSNNTGLPLDSPSKACQYYLNRWEKGFIRVVSNTPELCVVEVGDSNTGLGEIRGYISGNQFCLKSSGAYFNNAGVADSISCSPSSRTDNVQPQKTPPKIVAPTPKEPSKPPVTSDSKTFNNLDSADKSNWLNGFLSSAGKWTYERIGRMMIGLTMLFDGAKNFLGELKF